MKQTQKKYGTKGILREKWKGLVAQWKESGKSQSAFCREKRIKPSTFSYWARKSRSKAIQLPVNAPSELVQIERILPRGKSVPIEMSSAETSLTLGLNGMTLQFNERLSPQRLKGFLLAIGGS